MNFEAPKAEIIIFSTEDVITTSSPGGTGGSGGIGGENELPDF